MFRTKRQDVFFVAILAVLAALGLWIFSGSAGCQRAMKSFRSDFSGGLNRTVTVYGYTGEVIRSWTGKFDVSEHSDEMYFDIDGKRVIIQGGIVVNEEM